MDSTVKLQQATTMNKVLTKLKDASANYIVDKIVDAAATHLKGQYYWKIDLQEELRNVRRLRPQIQAVVGFAEHRLPSNETSNPALTEWLRQFIDVMDEAKKVLDELKNREVEENSESNRSRFSMMLDPCVRAAKRFLKCDDVLERLRACVKNLNTSASSVQQFLTLVTQQSINQSTITSSLPELSFKGREQEKRQIIQSLLGDSAGESEIQRSENVHCLSLVAMDGMGKTALAQQVFDHFENDDVNKKHFDIKIWVCVSNDFNASNLMKKILESSTRRSESGPLELIPVKLKEELHSKRFLLVLDAAGDDKNRTEWEKLCAPLLHGQKGSWILLTTRLRSVANMFSNVIRGTVEPMMLRGLSNDECRSLLYEHAFVGRDPNEFPQLKEIGEKIVEKLGGVPRLAKSIGGELNIKLETEHWEEHLEKVLKMTRDSRDEVIPTVTL